MRIRRRAEAESPADDSSGGQPPEQLNIQALRQWQSDLEGFVAQIRSRVKSLSQSMKNHRLRRRAGDPNANPAANHNTTPANHPPASVQGPMANGPAGADPQAAPQNDENDPLAQLDAIKRRLAEQLENS